MIFLPTLYIIYSQPEDFLKKGDSMVLDKVWLVAWKSYKWNKEDQHVPENHLAALLKGDLPASCVREIVEVMHANRCYSIEERLMSAKNEWNPYKAEINDSPKWGEMIMCGHDPHLYAIRIGIPEIVEEDNKKYLVWT